MRRTWSAPFWDGFDVALTSQAGRIMTDRMKLSSFRIEIWNETIEKGEYFKRIRILFLLNLSRVSLQIVQAGKPYKLRGFTIMHRPPTNCTHHEQSVSILSECHRSKPTAQIKKNQTGGETRIGRRSQTSFPWAERAHQEQHRPSWARRLA